MVCSRIPDSGISHSSETYLAFTRFVSISTGLGIQLTAARHCRKDKAEGSVGLCDVKQDVSSEALASPSLGDAGSVNSKFFSTLAPVRSLFTRPQIALVK